MSSVEGGGYRAPVGESLGLPRWLEVLVALVGLVFAAPILLVCIIAIKLTSRGPVFFRQDRVGRRGAFFTLHKLRTMRVQPSSWVLHVTAHDDDRITALGKILRTTKLDELPQLWNVLVGDLSLVGPRPEVPRFVDLGNPLWREVLKVRPGLTDPVTLKLRNEEELLGSVGGNREAFYREVLQPYKLRGSVEYLRNRTSWTDLEVLARTLIAVVRPSSVPPPSIADLSRRPEARQELGGGAPSTRTGAWRRITTRDIQYLLDLGVLASAFLLSYMLRFDFDISPAEQRYLQLQLPWVLALQFGALLLSGVHRSVWRYVGIREARRFLDAAVWSGAGLLALRLFVPVQHEQWRIPISVILVDTVLGFCGALGMRVLRRISYEDKRRGTAQVAPTAVRRRVLLLGAGQAGVLAAREILGRGDFDIDIQGFVDDDPRKQGAVIYDIPVLGTTADLAQLVSDLHIQDVVITIAQISRKNIVRMIEQCRKIGVVVRIIPGLYEILQGKVRMTRIRDVEIEDLLGRERVELDKGLIGDFVANKRVLVTGAGGSIGSELARQVARFGPASLLLLERAEGALFEIDRDLRRLFPNVSVTPIVADVGDEPWIRTIFRAHSPDVVFHAAAHKHVPMMEQNACEAIKNNVFGTRVIAEVAAESGVEAFVMISTDKAVRPTSVMGASKRVAELVIQDLARSYTTRFVAVRFGNVMGSAGSVIPLFREQIRRGGPVTVTDPEMKRYFMTIPEASQLVMQAGAMGRGGEIFILDMGTPVRVLDLAVAMINLSGLTPFVDMEIEFTGLRPGEKLFEELELDGEGISKTRHPKIFIGLIAPYPSAVIQRALEELRRLAQTGDPVAIREYLNELLPEATLSRSVKPQPSSGATAEWLEPASKRERKTNPPEVELHVSPFP